MVSGIHFIALELWESLLILAKIDILSSIMASRPQTKKVSDSFSTTTRARTKHRAKVDVAREDPHFAERTNEDLHAFLLALNDTALVSETDWQGDIIYANDKFVEISKYSREELIGQNHRILKSDYHSQQFYMDLWGTIISGRVWRGKLKNRAKDGTYYWVDTSIVPIVGKDGKPIKYISVRFPITEQMVLQSKLEKLNVKLEERIQQRTTELRKSEEHFRELTNSMPQLVWTALPDGRVDYYNDKHKEHEGIGKKGKQFVWSPVVHPDDIDKTVHAWKQAIHAGTTYEIEHRIRMKKGGYRWHLSRGVPIKDKQKNVIKWYGTATDIHEQKQLEQQKDEFLGVASHELKTPLTSIKAYTQVMKTLFMRKGDEKSFEYLQKMDTQLNKLNVLIGDLLDVTKIQAGRLQLRPDYFDFNELVEEVIKEMQLTTQKHTISKALSRTIILYGDRDRIGQVIINFLSNAIKYSPHANKIIVRTEVENNEVKLCVQDFGVGIPEEKKEKVFERFYRVEGLEKNTYPGLGLGLYISSEIIKRHAGRTFVDSKEGEGSTFCFCLPVK